MGRAGKQWCILRTSGTNTVGLAKALAEAGYEAWTPIEPRTRLAGRNRKPVEQELAVTPSFVFACSERLYDLAVLSRTPGMVYRVWDSEKQAMVAKGIPQFRVFKVDGKYPLIADSSLATLRTIERAAIRQHKPFEVGEKVILPERGFEGLTGTVEKTKGQYAWVLFTGFPMAIQIATLHLLRNSVDQEPSAIAA